MSKQTALIVVLTAVTAFSLGAAAPQSEDAARLKELHQEWVAIFTEFRDRAKRAHEIGNGTVTALAQKEIELREVLIDAAQTKAEKLSLLQERLEFFTLLEDRKKALFVQEGIPHSALAKATADRIKAEIDLLTLKMNERE